MPLPVLPGVLRIVVSGHVNGGGVWANTWHARNISLADFDAASILAFHAIFSQFYIGPSIGAGFPMIQFLSTLSNVQKIQYTPLNGTSGAFEHPANAAGTSAGASLPAEVCEVLTIRTADRGRQNRGRVFLPAVTIGSQTSASHIDGNTIDGLIAQIAGVETALEAGGAELGVGSYGPYKGAGVPHFTPVNSFSMDDLFDVQRRRKT